MFYEDEFWFDFESVGTRYRYLEDRIDGLEKWIIQFRKRIYKEKQIMNMGDLTYDNVF